ncbi:hypothetical protein [Streptomyces sp. NPDC047009]|uniref:hypothetical protein n=1 Tax=Streptomyces sp. NPDC047009 TaxID=3154496 RepID=UPI00340BFD4F
MVIKRSFRISAALALTALAVLVGAQYGHVASRHVEADTTWSVPVGTPAGVTPQDTTRSVPANPAAVEHAARPADTTW